MKEYIYTDLATEFKNQFDFSPEINITENIKKIYHGANIEDCFGVTIFTPKISELTSKDFFLVQKEITAEIKRFTERYFKNYLQNKNFTALIVGLGNPNLTPDSLGVETVKKITVTNYLNDEQLKLIKHKRIAAIIPDVTGNTGIETADIVTMSALCIDPNIIIVIDSLAARSCNRLASTIQISDIGISPGSGLSKTHKKIDFHEIGVPVISVGVPTVVNSATLLADCFETLAVSSDFQKEIKETLPTQINFFVTPKEIDIIIKDAALLLAGALDMVFSLE